ncbi:hypothetical protein SEA_YELLOWPANDA_46 [Microbacterium phage YellowPanda]|uniref:Uncharacterized protein n=2 Tax=Tinytimothyvirus tinytimothy TaxID=2845596 RepID=A0A5Q2WH47_9CAUD|nr:hypothetical protein HWC33_gp43 [Microbacterium phage TinyTimothy]QDF16996.1 hypothetical protein SEA_TINYTIMOTHY_43 [Microbacterium phage TinyTimothy]QGH78685.1 hypothetical protein SEA_WESAK_44 [Microbacterium phage Wesak]
MNPEVAMTLDDAVASVLGRLTGLDLSYVPEYDRYQAVTRQLNEALQAVALEKEWSYYSSTEDIGVAHAGDRVIELRQSVRPRVIGDDSVRLVDENTGRVRVWASFVPRDALSKYRHVAELKAAYTRSTVEFSRELWMSEDGLRIQLPVMREPKLFRLPPVPEDPDDPPETVPQDVREQLVDFDNPTLVIAKAAYFYAQSNPLWQPRVQTLDANYKDLMYALTERDGRNTDAPYQNEWTLGIESGITDVNPWSGRQRADYGRGY